MRLDKYLHDSLGVSRSEARKLVRGGRVLVGACRITDPSRRVSQDDAVILDEQRLDAPANRYIMLHKPAGVVCATRDKTHVTVIDLLDLVRNEELSVAGRLDIDATGLVLLSDDGQWIHRITSPRHKQPKQYLVHLAESLSDDAERRFAKGIHLRNDKKRTRPAALERVADRVVRIRLIEGRYHQVKRMFATLGNRVIRLHREAIGNVTLDPSLKPGSWRMLSTEEVGKGI